MMQASTAAAVDLAIYYTYCSCADLHVICARVTINSTAACKHTHRNHACMRYVLALPQWIAWRQQRRLLANIKPC